jgi:type II secretory pathway component PulF
MIDPELSARLDALEVQVEKAYHSAESVRKYLFWTGVATIVLVVLPAIALAFVIPQFISSYTATLGGAGI